MTEVRLRHLAQVNPQSPAFDRLPADAELTFLPMEAIWSDDRLDISRVRTKSSVAVGYTRFQDGDVLVPKITPTFEAGRSVLVGGLLNGAGAGTTELHVLRPGPNIDGRFLYYLTHMLPFLKLGAAEMYGVAGQKRVPDDFLRDFAVDLPVLWKQRRIADFLDRECMRLSKLEAADQQLLTRLDERDRAVVDLEVDGLVRENGVRPLRRALTKVEQGASPQCENAAADPGAWGVLKVSSVKRGEFFPGENKRLPDGVLPQVRYQIRNGDLLITRANTPALVGSVALVGEVRARLLLCDKIFRVALSDDLDAEFVALVAGGSRIRSLCAAASHGTSQSMVNLKIDEIKEWPVPLASVSQQRDLVRRVKAARQVTTALRGRIVARSSLLAERRQALITAAVTGQFDVSTASGVTV